MPTNKGYRIFRAHSALAAFIGEWRWYGNANGHPQEKRIHAGLEALAWAAYAPLLY